MSDRWRQRRKRCYEWLTRFDRVNGTESNLDDMLRRVLGRSDEDAEARDSCSGRREGISMPPSKDSEIAENSSEPLVDVFEDQESVIVVTELTGIDKNHVDLHTTQDKLTISVDSPDLKYHREIELPTRVHVGSSSSRLKNGVLEIRLKKLQQELVVR